MTAVSQHMDTGTAVRAFFQNFLNAATRQTLTWFASLFIPALRPSKIDLCRRVDLACGGTTTAAAAAADAAAATSATTSATVLAKPASLRNPFSFPFSWCSGIAAVVRAGTAIAVQYGQVIRRYR